MPERSWMFFRSIAGDLGLVLNDSRMLVQLFQCYFGMASNVPMVSLGRSLDGSELISGLVHEGFNVLLGRF